MHRRGIKGQTRLTVLLANRLRSLQAVPITLPGCPPLFVDLRQDQAHELLKGTPWETDPWDIGEREVMRRVIRQGDTVFDIGANIGFQSVLISALVGPRGSVFAFEPNPALTPALRQTMKSLGNAELFVLALSNEDGDTRLFVPVYNPMASLANWTKPWHDAGSVRGVPCKLRRVDGLIAAGALPRPDVIKCDVEGAELLVFRGARDLLNSPDAPVVMFEVNQSAAAGFGFAVGDAIEFLASLSGPGFRFYQIHPDGTLGLVDTPLPTFCNVIAVPAARTDRLSALVPRAD